MAFQEIEIRALVSDTDRVVPHLIHMGFTKSQQFTQEDIMLDHPNGELFISGRKIRIRTENDHVELTYKGPFKGDPGVSRRDQVDVRLTLEEKDNMMSIFAAIGYSPLFSIRKTRIIYNRGNIKVTLDDWPIIGWLLELEGPETEIKALALALPADLEFGNFRLVELFNRTCKQKGCDLETLKKKYEAENDYKLGNLSIFLT